MNPATGKRIESKAILNEQSRWSVSQILRRPLHLLKRIYRLGNQLFLTWVDATYDLFRYLRYSNSVLNSSEDRQKLEPLLFFYYHKIEKSLSLPTVKPLFGLGYIGTTLDLAEKWAQSTGDLEAVVFRGAYAALNSYQEHVNQPLLQARPDLARRLDQFLTRYTPLNRDPNDGGTLTVSHENMQGPALWKDFERLVYHRHSVRSFVVYHIPDSTISYAVKLAQRTPSVCNRQCWRVHVFTSPADKAKVLQQQNGNEGFGHLADRVLLLTADLRSFLTSGERHQASVDTGMFAMTLILALESQGIASCCLNLCLSSSQEIALRRSCKISAWEKPVMMIAIGYPPENLKVAASARKSTDSMLYFRDLNQESLSTNKGLFPIQAREDVSMKSHTLLLVNGSYSNRGCEAIMRGTTTLLRNQLGECRFISNYFPSQGCRDAEFEIDPTILHRPFPLLKRYSILWIEEQITRKVFRQPPNIVLVSRLFRRSLRKAEAVLMMGGDSFRLDNPNANTYFSLCRLAIKAGVPVVIWGASIGPFTGQPAYEQWAAKELRKVTLICARETVTVKYLESIGVSKNVVLTADPAFYLQPTACKLPVEIENTLVEGCIGLNLSPLLSMYVKLPGAEPNLSAWIKVAVEIVRNLLNQISLPVLLIPHVTSEVGDVYRDDYLFLNRVAQLLGEPEQVLLLGSNLNAAQTKWVISRLRAFAGARTHSTLAAISSGVPTICIGYSMKARGIAQDVYGHLDWLISGEDLVKDPLVLRDRFTSLLSQETDIRRQLEQINPIMQQRATAAADRIGELINIQAMGSGN